MNPDTFYKQIETTYGHTQITPLAFVLTLGMGIALLLLDRRYAIVPFLIVTLYITEAQRIVVASLDFNMIRIMVLFGWVRVLLRNEHRFFRFTQIDGLLIAFAISSVAAYSLLYKTSEALIYKLGFAFNIIGMYFLFRVLLRNISDLKRTAVALSFLVVPIMVSMLNEQVTARNWFAVFGGVSEFTLLREGRLRAQASFAHPILAGTFGAVLVPVFLGLYQLDRKCRALAVVGIASGLVIVLACSSSGPVISLLAAFSALFLWKLRNSFRDVKMVVVVMLIGLQLSMDAPIWALLAKIDIVGGSTGYHRYILVDEFIKRFREWFLFGVQSTAHWGFGLFDVTNQYVAVGVDGGFICLVLFLRLLVAQFRSLGRSVFILSTDTESRFFLWGLGAALFVHCVSFLGISYFDQIIVIWYLTLAMIPTAERDLQETREVACVSQREARQVSSGRATWPASKGV